MMSRVLIALLIVPALVISPIASAQVCTNPFDQMTQSFQLTSKLVCNGVTSPVVMAISPTNQTTPSSAPYLSPGCDSTTPFFDLYVGKEIVAYTDAMVNAQDDVVRVLGTCDAGERIFLIERTPELLNTPFGGVNTCHRVFAEDEARTLLGYVLVTEDTANSLTLRSPSGSVAAVASKSFSTLKEKDSCYEATWKVVNNDNSEATATIMAYILVLKDNADFDCAPIVIAKCPQQSSFETAGQIATGVLIGGVAGVFGTLAFKKVTENYKRLGQ